MTMPISTAPAQDERFPRAEATALDALASDEITSDEITSDEITSDEITSDEITSDEITADDLIPDQPALALNLRDLVAASAPEEPPIWPVPWREEDAAPWWQRAWAHGQGTWLGTALAVLLVLGVLGAGMALHLAPASPTAASAPHPTTPATAHPAPTRAASASPLTTTSTTHAIWQSSTTRSGSGGHSGHGHQRK